MPAKRNQVVPNAHFHKQWQRRVKCWFNQPARKQRRHRKRVEKSQRVAPRPRAVYLRPVVRCPTIKYNKKQREGRGFTVEELKGAGLSRNYARTIGIAVDLRRRNKSVEALQLNIQRLNEYKSKLIIYPKPGSKGATKDSSTAEELSKAQQIDKFNSKLSYDDKHRRSAELTKAMVDYKAFKVLKHARWEKKTEGKRRKAAQDAENK